MSAVVVDIGSAAVIAAAIRLERCPLCAHKRRILARRLAEIAAGGDLVAAMLRRRLLDRSCRPRPQG